MSDDKKIVQMPNPAEQPVSNGSSALVATAPRSIFEMTQDHFDRLKIMAKMYAASAFNSGNNKLTEGDAFIIMMKGIEVGLSPMAAMDFINVIQGKPTIDGKGMLALIRSSGKAEYVNIDSQPERCIVTTKRSDGGKEQRVEWDMSRARQFKVYEKGQWKALADRSQWRSQPQVMLKWRAVAEMAREVYPDVIGGLYTKEEISDSNVVVLDDGSMQLPESTEPKRAEFKDGKRPKRMETGVNDDKPPHFANDNTARAKFFDRAIKLGMGENVKDAWVYLQKNWADKPLGGMSDLPANLTDAMKRLEELGKELQAEVGAPEDYWTSERITQATDIVRTTWGRPVTAFENAAETPLIDLPNIDTALRMFAEIAIDEGWTFRTTKLEYAKMGNAKVMIYHLPEPVQLLDEAGNPLVIKTFGGRRKVQTEIGTDAYTTLGIEDYELGNTYDLPAGTRIEFNVELTEKDGNTYADAKNLTAVLPDAKPTTEPLPRARKRDDDQTNDIPF